MLWTPCPVRPAGPDGEVRASLSDPLVDDYLRFVAARSRPNTVLATAYDLKVFFSVVGKEPARVSTTDVMGFLVAQRAPRRGTGVVCCSRTVSRRCRHARSSADWQVFQVCSRICWPVMMSMCGVIRCRAVWACGTRWPPGCVGCR